MRVVPIRSAILMVPTLLDWAMMSAIVICWVGCGCASWKTHWGHWLGSSAMKSGTVNCSSGETRCSWIAAEAVMTLFTDPGSYTSTMAGFCRHAQSDR